MACRALGLLSLLLAATGVPRRLDSQVRLGLEAAGSGPLAGTGVCARLAGSASRVAPGGFGCDGGGALAVQAQSPGIEVSENPVRSSSVVISWPAGTGAPRLGVYTFVGKRLVSVQLAPGSQEYAWDLTAGGRAVAPGAYLLVLELDGRVYRRRLFVTRP